MANPRSKLVILSPEDVNFLHVIADSYTRLGAIYPGDAGALKVISERVRGLARRADEAMTVKEYEAIVARDGKVSIVKRDE